MYIRSKYHDNHENNNIILLDQVLEKKISYFLKFNIHTKPLSCLKTIKYNEYMILYINIIYYILHTMIPIKTTTYFCLLNFFQRKVHILQISLFDTRGRSTE